MISFYPGPSKIYPAVATYMQDAFMEGILSQNHRSEGFMRMMGLTIGQLKLKLNVPEDYEVFFTSSATECWEIIAQSFTDNGAIHLYNGAFGQKWKEYDEVLNEGVEGYAFPLEQLPELGEFQMQLSNKLVCLTHNETSNGTYLPNEFLLEVRSRSNQLIAVDATSSMAGIDMPWLAADIWYASVQKCFGMPPGMAVFIVSPKAIDKAETIGERNHYNSFLFMRDNFLKLQTPYTPNTLGIYMLGRSLYDAEPIWQVDRAIRSRAQDLYSYFESLGYVPVMQQEILRSPTVIAIRVEPEMLVKLKYNAKQANLLLGNGYGSWKNNTFRIANFPAISQADIDALKTFFRSGIK